MIPQSNARIEVRFCVIVISNSKVAYPSKSTFHGEYSSEDYGIQGNIMSYEYFPFGAQINGWIVLFSWMFYMP